ncbi:DUF6362 family protein [Roseibium alexandrii]|uniref:DUF6362 domain-containing protein n=1 Tax=Roseibium alexandrii TaxID=388408 RepID=A0A0M6ZWN0_9HYPH|nr:DUF6362 family protein [Roseibium alexandrii]CTQ67168.1 hypothetical protein LAX5112_01245 [Roseibium alexandrii]
MTLAELESLILDRLLEAQVCMKALRVTGVRPGLPSTFWPETETNESERWHVVKDQIISGIKTDDPLKPRRAPPPAAAISRMEETWGWLAGIRNENSRKAVAIKVFAWVHKESTSTLARNMGINRVTLNRRYNAGMEELMARFCKTSVLPDPADEDLVHHFRPNQAMSNRNIAASAA